MTCQDLHRRRKRRWLVGAACICAAVCSGPERSALAQNVVKAPAEETHTPVAEKPFKPSFLITPTLGLQEDFTDNALLTSSNRRSDFITRGTVDVRVDLDHGPATAGLSARFAYDRYARVTELSGWTFDADAQAAYALIPDRLSLEAEGTLNDQYASTFSASALDRSGTPNRTEVGVYYIGPKLTTRVGDFADLSAAARFGQVLYWASDNSVVTQLPADDNLFQAVARLDTGDHGRTFQLLTTAEVEGDKLDYRFGTIAQSVFVRVLPGVRLIARAGYERVYQPGVTNIGAPLLSAGLEFRPNASSRLSVEGGQRYHRSAWAADANIRLSDKFLLTGHYAVSLTPDQLYLANAFSAFIVAQAELPTPPPFPGGGFGLPENLYNQTSYNKRGELRLLHAGPIQSIDLAALWSERRFLVSNARDRSVSGSVNLTRRLRPDLNLIASADYTHTFASPLYGPSESYGFRGGLAYLANSTTEARAEYRYKHGLQLRSGGLSFAENAVLVSIQKRF